MLIVSPQVMPNAIGINTFNWRQRTSFGKINRSLTRYFWGLLALAPAQASARAVPQVGGSRHGIRS
jgi:hypothetical protein